jgi:hypothetical protein
MKRLLALNIGVLGASIGFWAMSQYVVSISRGNNARTEANLAEIRRMIGRPCRNGIELRPGDSCYIIFTIPKEAEHA